MNKKGEAEGLADLWIYLTSIIIFTLVLMFLFFVVKGTGGTELSTINLTGKGNEETMAKKYLIDFLKQEVKIDNELMSIHQIVTLVDFPKNNEIRIKKFKEIGNKTLNKIDSKSNKFKIINDPNSYIIIAEPDKIYYVNTNGKYYKFKINTDPFTGYAISRGSPGLCGIHEVIVKQRIQKINNQYVDVVMCIQKEFLK